MSRAEPLPQLTPKAILLGIVLSAILAGANAYLGLFAGLTVSASIPAAVISMAVLKFFRNSNILENNIVQTAASAGESIAAGVIFTMPALIILGYWQVFDYVWVSLIAGLGGLLFSVRLTSRTVSACHCARSVATAAGCAALREQRIGRRAWRGIRRYADCVALFARRRRIE